MLKRLCIFCSFIIAIVLCPSPLWAVPDLEVTQTILSYFKALKTGDIESLKYYTSEVFYEKNRILLEHNKSYKDFLKKYYTGTEVEVVETIYITDDEVVVQVEVFFPNQSISLHKFSLKKYDHIWKINEELH
jgi:hypothetical protein